MAAMDEMGLDTIAYAFEYLESALARKLEGKMLLQQKNQENALGLKSEKGFYDYHNQDVLQLLHEREKSLSGFFNSLAYRFNSQHFVVFARQELLALFPPRAHAIFASLLPINKPHVALSVNSGVCIVRPLPALTALFQKHPVQLKKVFYSLMLHINHLHQLLHP